MMQILVQTPEGKTTVLDVKASDTIDKVKRKIRKKDGIPMKHQRLIFAEQHLSEGGKTLSEHNIVAGSILFLLLCVVGGGKRAATRTQHTSKEEKLLLLQMRAAELMPGLYLAATEECRRLAAIHDPAGLVKH